MYRMKEPDLKKLLPAAEKIARRAGHEIMKHYEGTAIYTKTDGSNVTDADYAAENIILPALAKLTPDIPIISEERVAAGHVPDISKGTFWTVDPLDGTHEFINKTGAFVVAIALIVDSRPVLGVVYHPAMNLMYSGAGPGTATKVDKEGVCTPLPDAKKTAKKMRVLINPHDIDKKYLKGLTAQFNVAANVNGKSGILRACQVAESLADMALVYAKNHQGRTAFWDVAAGHAIVEASGGRIETLDGQSLLYNAEDLRVPPHVILSPQQAVTAKKHTPQL
jgi:3'(2'), 5'-bisphosphate nucleotidase